MDFDGGGDCPNNPRDRKRLKIFMIGLLISECVLITVFLLNYMK